MQFNRLPSVFRRPNNACLRWNLCHCHSSRTWLSSHDDHPSSGVTGADNKTAKRIAVISALQHPKGAKLSDRQIAEHVGVSAPFVGKLREKLSATVNGLQIDIRTGREPLEVQLVDELRQVGEFYREPTDEVKKNIAAVTA